MKKHLKEAFDGFMSGAERIREAGADEIQRQGREKISRYSKARDIGDAFQNTLQSGFDKAAEYSRGKRVDAAVSAARKRENQASRDSLTANEVTRGNNAEIKMTSLREGMNFADEGEQSTRALMGVMPILAGDDVDMGLWKKELRMAQRLGVIEEDQSGAYSLTEEGRKLLQSNYAELRRNGFSEQELGPRPQGVPRQLN